MGKKALGFYFGGVSAVLGIAATVLYFQNISNSYFANQANALTVFCSVAAVLLMAAFIALAGKAGASKGLELARGLAPIAATFCLFAALVNFLSTRVYSMAIIYGSSLEANNTLAHSAMAQAIVTMVLYLAAGIMAILAAFTKTQKDEQ